ERALARLPGMRCRRFARRSPVNASQPARGLWGSARLRAPAARPLRSGGGVPRWRALRAGAVRNRRLRFELAQAPWWPRMRRGLRRYRARRAAAGATSSWPGSPRALFREPVRSFRAARRTAVRRPAAELQHRPGEEERAETVRR